MSVVGGTVISVLKRIVDNMRADCAEPAARDGVDS